jgi:hypothetical protein
MSEEKRINIFKIETAKNLIACSAFKEFLVANNQFQDLSWEEYQDFLSKQIIGVLNNFKNIVSIDKKNRIPKEGLKGIYFCVGDNALSLDIAASLYFNEADWAANADFYQHIDQKMINEIAFKLKRLNLEEKTIANILCCFLVYVINRSLKKIENISELSNTGIAFGYSDGDELILGHFENGKFVENITIIENGQYN